MLLINTKQHQSVIIGHKVWMELDRINYTNGHSSVEFTLHGDDDIYIPDKYLVQGDSCQLAERVAVTLVKVIYGAEKVAVLGFDAPREIPIYGEWMRREHEHNR